MTMTASHVLNPTLYSLLERRFGAGNVKVIAGGEAMLHHTELRPAMGRKSLVPTMVVDHPGEEYMVNCPFCGDTRQRLSINHRYGTKGTDEKPMSLRWLFRCYNEECQNDHGNRTALYEEVFVQQGQANADGIIIHEGKSLPEETEPKPIDPPGYVVPLDELKVEDPNHKAIVYLEKRHFDAGYLAKQYAVGYCADSKYALAKDRIIVPLLHQGQWFGWQARYIGDDYKARGVPKYWTAPGTKRSKLMYNYELAIKHQTVVIVEGPSDVWGFGPQAMGCWGKSMSGYNRNKLINDLREDGTVVILLDPKQDDASLKQGKPHHIDKLYNQLLPSLAGRLLRIFLPDENSDPGSLNKKYMRELIKCEAKKYSVSVSFKKDF